MAKHVLCMYMKNRFTSNNENEPPCHHHQRIATDIYSKLDSSHPIHAGIAMHAVTHHAGPEGTRIAQGQASDP